MPLAVGIIADAYTAPPGAWTPASLTGLWAWWDTSNAASITHSSGAVSQIDDLSGNSRYLFQSNNTYKPTTGTHTINGLNVFNYGTKALATTSLTLVQPLTVAMIVKGDAVSTQQRCLGAETFIQTSASTNGRWNYGSSTLVTTTIEHDANPYLVVLIANGATSKLRVRGVEIWSANAGTNGWTSAPVYIGANSATGGTGWRNQIGETLITNTVVSGTDLTNLETYMMTKWGIT